MPLKPMYGREKDIRMMSNPIDWPRWPRLPVKRSDPKFAGQVEVGIMMAMEGQLTTVWITTLFSEVDPETTPKIVYTDHDAVADDGWVVD